MKALSIFFLTSLFSSLAFATNECERVGKVKWVKFESEKPGEVYLFKVNDDDSSRSVLKYNDEEQCEEFLGPFSQGSVNHTLVNELEVFLCLKGSKELMHLGSILWKRRVTLSQSYMVFLEY